MIIRTDRGGADSRHVMPEREHQLMVHLGQRMALAYHDPDRLISAETLLSNIQIYLFL